MTTTPERCELCGDKYHEDPDPQAGWADLRCPGANAPEVLKHEFSRQLSEAFSKWVREQALEAANEAEKLAEDIFARKQEWYRRNRTEVTHDELQADCDKRVPEVRAELTRAEAENRAELDIDPAHTTVPLEPENDPSKRPAFIRTAARHAHPEDALLYVDPPRGPEPGPADPDPIPPYDGYYNH